jgi:sarcosine oxidase subunit alpha
MKRLPPVPGELIDRAQSFEFVFEGKRFLAHPGDTISSALLASGVRVLGRSFKYHRPRGILSAAGHDVNALMQVRGPSYSVPNVRADVIAVQKDWQIHAVNTRGGLKRDRLRVLDHFAPFLPVGFYYKAFHSKRLFPLWERMFRHITGLGRVDLTAPRRPTPKRYDFCDVLVVGAGPSGLAAALAAAERGAQVLLVDENTAPGGSGLYARGGERAGADEVSALVKAVGAHSRIRLLAHTYAAGYYADHWVALVAPECLIKVRARSVVIAQGAYEMPAVFRGNDLPGVMLASAAQRLIYRYAVAPATRIAVLTANPEGYAAAQDALAHGIGVAAVLDLRSDRGELSRETATALTRAGVALHQGVTPLEASGRGNGLAELLYRTAATGAAPQRLALDGLWMSVGFAPANALLHQAGAAVRYEPAAEQFVPDQLPDGVYACGKINGHYGLADRLADGNHAGAQAAFAAGHRGTAPAPPPQLGSECRTHAYPIFPHRRHKEFIDFDEDLQVCDIENACQEGFDSSELLKRFSTIGMGPSQGKHSNMNALRVLARVRGEPLERVGTTTARPMFHPVPMAHLAGRGFTPERRTPVDALHASLGAVWMPAGNWRRPEYYAVAGKARAEAIAEEVRAVRTRAGLIDVGTLGKIEAHGPHAAEFLERIYTARFANLKIGMTRYGLMLDESAVVVDDGVIARLAEERFYFTTTTGNSATLFREFGRLAAWWGLPVGLVNLTGHMAAFNLAGPASRTILRALTGLDLDRSAFPYLGVREALVASVPCRIMRVGFVGELGYEIHAPAQQGAQLWSALLESGRAHGIRPFGVEAQRMLRLEKGHIIVGQDSDGVTNALELDMPWAIKMDKKYFVGQRSLRIIAKAAGRQTLVGFKLSSDRGQELRECNLVIADGRIAGRITSVGRSPTLECHIGLALVEPAVAAGGRLQIRTEQKEEVTASIVSLPFYDPQGERQMIEDKALAEAAS